MAIQTYYIYTGPSQGFQPVKGRAITIPGYENYDFFLHGTSGAWRVSDAKTGSALTHFADTIKDAKDKARQSLDRIGSTASFEQQQAKALKESGVSPRYLGKYLKAETSKPTPEAKVKGITYYRGVSRHAGMEAPTGERRRPSVYLTRSEREAKFYGKDIEKVTVNPKNPMYSETAVDAAEKLGVIKDYDKYIGSDPIKADEVIYNAAKKAGYDAIIRRDGDWVQVIDKDIISPIGKPAPEAKEPWKMTRDEWYSQIAESQPRQGMTTVARARQIADAAEKQLGVTGTTHYGKIEKALKEGKPVPAEVLKDYPELGKKETEEGVKPLPQEGSIIVRGNLVPIAYEINGKKYKASAVLAPTRGRLAELHNDIYFGSYKVGTGKEITKAHIDKGIALAKAEAKPEPKAEGKGIRRDKRNIGKLATVIPHGTGVDGRTVKILGFRGDQRAGVPFVTVYDIQAKQSLPMPADKLRLQPTTKVKEPEPKLKKEIAKPKKATKPHKETLREIAASRVAQSERAIAIDRALLAKQVVSVDDPRWLKQPNRFDVRGVDTPGSGRVTSRTGFTDRGKTRMSRRHHRGWKRIKL